MKMRLSVCLLAVLLASPAYAQMAAMPAKARPAAVRAPSPNPITTGEKANYEMVKGYILKSAEIAPDSVFDFKATSEVRTFGQIVGHIADSNYMMCSAAAGAKSPGSGDIEKTKTGKAELSQALAESFAYCDKVYAAMTDVEGSRLTKWMMGGEMAKLSILSFNTAHDFEHYGNLVTYFRLNNIVPPSTASGAR